jgi:hypothetical protein
MKSTMFAMFTLIGLAFAGSASAAPPGAAPRGAERDDVQVGDERGDAAPSTDSTIRLCPPGYHRDTLVPNGACVPDDELLRAVHPNGTASTAEITEPGSCDAGSREVCDRETGSCRCEALPELGGESSTDIEECYYRVPCFGEENGCEDGWRCAGLPETL